MSNLNDNTNTEGVVPQKSQGEVTAQSGIPFGLTELLTKDGLKPASEVLAGKTTLGFYFSAHWCPPCQMFTPILDAYYKAAGVSESEMEIIFVSSDRDQHAFEEYYGEMSFKALPYSLRDKKAELSEFFDVGGIPTLVFTDMNGLVKTNEGRDSVMGAVRDVMIARIAAAGGQANFQADPELQKLEFNEVEASQFIVSRDEVIAMEGKAKPEFFGLEKVTDGETEISTKELRENNPAIAFYFSASWCGPCRGFTPLLKEFYENTRGTGLEIVFVGLDRTVDDHNAYFAKMPWKAMDYEDERESLAQKFRVQGIPDLVICDRTGKKVEPRGVGAVKKLMAKNPSPAEMQALAEEWVAKCQ